MSMSVEMAYGVCPICGCPYAHPKRQDDMMQKDGDQSMYCPNGHQLVHGVTSDKKLVNLEGQVEDLQMELNDVRDYKDELWRSNNALRGVITKLKRRNQ